MISLREIPQLACIDDPTSNLDPLRQTEVETSPNLQTYLMFKFPNQLLT